MSALVAVVTARLAFDAAAIVLFGASCFLDWMVPENLSASLVVSVARIRFFPIVAFIAAVTWLPFDAATIAGNWDAALDLQFLQALALATSGGHAWLLRCLVSLAAAGVFGLSVTRGRVLVAGLLVASLSLSGHTLLQSGSLVVLHIINDALHVLAGSIWLGSLVMLPSCLTLLDHPEVYRDARLALQRFSKIGHVAVAVVILTGAINSVLTLGHRPTRPISPYVVLLSLKIMLVAVMTVLAAINRYVFVPRIRFERTKAIAQIKAGTWSEVVLGVGVLTLVATFGVFDPH
jgi:putative copper resistance protein D